MNAVGAARDARLPGRGPRSQKGGSETLSYFQFRKIASLVWKGVGEFGPGVDGGQRRVHRDAAGGAVVCAAFFAGGHGGDFVGDALFAFRFLGTRNGGGERDFEGFAGGVRFYVADAE